MNLVRTYVPLLLGLLGVGCAGGSTVVTGTGAPSEVGVPADPAVSADPTVPVAGDIVGCSFRVTGSTVDKLSQSATTASMDGSTLTLVCVKDATSSGNPAVLYASIKAFDGPGDYVLDQDQKLGELTYNGNDGYTYVSGYVGGGEELKSSCTFTFIEGPSDPKTGDTVVAWFHCEGLQGYRSGAYGGTAPRVDVLKGSLRATVK